MIFQLDLYIRTKLKSSALLPSRVNLSLLWTSTVADLITFEVYTFYTSHNTLSAQVLCEILLYLYSQFELQCLICASIVVANSVGGVLVA